MIDIYTDGFKDGLRYAGHLLEDVTNEEITLSTECLDYMNEKYREGGYSERDKKRYSFIKRLIEDCDRLYDENQRLRNPVENSDTVINYGV